MTDSLRDALVEYPKIDPALVPVRLSPDDVHFRAGPWSGTVFELSDDERTGRLADLVDMLDGTNTVEEILDAFGDDSDDVAEVLYLLQTEDVIFDGEDAIEREGVRGYVSAIDRFSGAELDRLAGSTVTLVGSGRTATDLARDAVEMGVGDVRLLSLHGTSVPEDLATASDVSTLDSENLAEAVEAADCVVYAADRPDPDATDRLNRLVHDAETPLLVGQVAGLDGVVGPTIIPGETACYECFRQRRYANVEAPEGYRAYEEVVADTSGAPGPNLPGFGRIVAGCLGLELVNQLVSGVGFTVGRIIHYDFADLSVEANDVLRMPRCSVCGESGDTVDHARHVSVEDMVRDRNGGERH